MIDEPVPRTKYRNLRLLRAGTPAVSQRRNEPAPPKPPRTPKPPAWLSAAARKEWKRLAPLMTAAHEWRPEYADQLAVYIVCLLSFKADPANFTAAQLSQLRMLAQDLGLTPRSRKNIAREGRKF